MNACILPPYDDLRRAPAYLNAFWAKVRKNCMQCAFALAAAAAAAGVVQAAEPTAGYNQVVLQAEAQREMPNDMLNATLYVELSDASPVALAAALNRAANEALLAAREFRSVRAYSGNNQTFPIYSKGNVLQAWRARAEIRLESRDFEAASRLMGKLQASMQLGGTTFSVSPEARQQAEDELIAQAVAAFKARARIVQDALSGRSYKIRNLRVNTGFNAPAPRFLRAMAASTAEVPAPGLEGGVSVVKVHTEGTIEVLD